MDELVWSVCESMANGDGGRWWAVVGFLMGSETSGGRAGEPTKKMDEGRTNAASGLVRCESNPCHLSTLHAIREFVQQTVNHA